MLSIAEREGDSRWGGVGGGVLVRIESTLL